MPDPYERHGRNSWEWGTSPPRGQSRAAAADQGLGSAKRPPAKKDPSLCKAQHWKGPHTPVFRIRQYGRQKTVCKWGANWGKPEPRWHCAHEEVCSECGKVLSAFVESRCPDFRPITEAEQEALDREIARWAERRSVRHRPVIDGPQGYRKRRV